MSIAVVATGGTIASLKDTATGMVRQALTPAELIESLPALAGVPELTEVTDVCRVNGWNMTPELMLTVVQATQDLVEQSDVEGVVVTHGTDTVEETAFLLDILVRSEKPVVLACAMRSGDEVSADGPRNLLNAFITAGTHALHGYGALVCMNDELHAARWATKSDSHRTGAFTSPDQGPIAIVSPSRGAVSLRSAPERWTSDVPDRLSHVPIIRAYTGMTGDGLDEILSRADGVVFEGSGLGNLPGGIQGTVAGCVGSGLPVVVATRVSTGGTHPLYGGLGGGATLRELGVTFAGRLPATKARLLLATTLATGRPTAAARFRHAVKTLQ